MHLTKFAIVSSIVVMLTLALSASAETYWVVGSFSNPANATNEAERLSSVLGETVESRFVPSRNTYRVLVPGHVLRSDLNSAGVDGWKVEFEAGTDKNTPTSREPTAADVNTSDALEPTPAAPTSTASSISTASPTPEANTPDEAKSLPEDSQRDDVGTAVETGVSEGDGTNQDSLYPEFLPGESQQAYCERLPASAFCQHPRVKEMLQKLKRIEAQKAQLIDECRNNKSASSTSICKDFLGTP